MQDAEKIKQLEEENEQLKKRLEQVLPDAQALSETLEAFKSQTATGIKGMMNTVKGLQDTANSLTEFAQRLQKMDKEELKKLFKKK